MKRPKWWIVNGTVLVRFKVEEVEVMADSEAGACGNVEEEHLDFNYSEIVESDLSAERNEDD